MATPVKPARRIRSVTRDVSWVAEAPKPHKAWIAALGIALGMLSVGAYCIYVLVTTGIGVWGNSNNRLLGVGHHELRLVDRYRSRRQR